MDNFQRLVLIMAFTLITMTEIRSYDLLSMSVYVCQYGYVRWLCICYVSCSMCCNLSMLGALCAREKLYVRPWRAICNNSLFAGPYHKELDIIIQGVLDSFAGWSIEINALTGCSIVPAGSDLWQQLVTWGTDICSVVNMGTFYSIYYYAIILDKILPYSKLSIVKT